MKAIFLKTEIGVLLIVLSLTGIISPVAAEQNSVSNSEKAESGEEVKSEDEIQASLEAVVPEKPVAGFSGKRGIGDSNRKEIPIQPGDRIRIKIYPEDDYVKGGEMQVSSDGNITLSLLGKIDIAGKTIIQAEREIAKMIDADYLVSPEVVIEMTTRSESAKRTVIVFGQVRKPGPYDFPPDKKRMTLLEVISLAGGFTEIANIKRIKIVRKLDGKKTVLNVNGEDVMNGKESDVEVEHGDVITVSESFF